VQIPRERDGVDEQRVDRDIAVEADEVRVDVAAADLIGGVAVEI
jgi:hypothetical protein